MLTSSAVPLLNATATLADGSESHTWKKFEDCLVMNILPFILPICYVSMRKPQFQTEQKPSNSLTKKEPEGFLQLRCAPKGSDHSLLLLRLLTLQVPRALNL